MKKWIQFISSRTVWVSIAGILGVISNDVFGYDIAQGTIDKALMFLGAIILWLLVGDVGKFAAVAKGKVPFAS